MSYGNEADEGTHPAGVNHRLLSERRVVGRW